MIIRLIICLLTLCIQITHSLSNTVDIKGKLDLHPREITHKDVIQTEFKLIQTFNYHNTSTNTHNKIYSSSCNLINSNGDFEFQNVPLDLNNNYTYYVLYAKSMAYNLKPNRILIQIENYGGANDTAVIRAFANNFGREYFPSPDILYPEKLPEINPYIIIKPISSAPFREYIQLRKLGFLQSGPLASIFESKWKTALAIGAISMFLVPFILEKLDPETAKAIKEERMRKQREKYNIPEQ
ncbi:Sop4p SCDLUD_004028 [Saccharomycodes ludwigii]|uniref:Sop4p n=1 Tax=Saccharomycodes ludwigii TaxID=36035 RepID=UPI001E81E2AE|nr:hypothetical protein SCDLUD_004028 [Saccharomycodes ludwigii]KAH3899742.1 hypothetical protein SCDLUD_004028 [Saccharomycodes ludwigii]